MKLLLQPLAHGAEQPHRARPVDDSAKPFLGNARRAHGGPGQPAGNRTYCICVAAAVQGRLQRSAEVAVVPQPGIDGHRHRLVNVSAHALLQPERDGELVHRRLPGVCRTQPFDQFAPGRIVAAQAGEDQRQKIGPRRVCRTVLNRPGSHSGNGQGAGESPRMRVREPG